MKRSGPLKRKTPLRRGPWRRKGKARAKSSYSQRPRYVPYMLAVKEFPCIVGWMPMEIFTESMNATRALPGAHVYAHQGDIEADHCGPRAMRRKAHDSTVVPICRNHHDQRTNGWGLFWGYTLAQKRAWKEAAIEATQAHARSLGIAVPEVEP